MSNNIPTGPMLLLKSLGFDPKMITDQIESAKTSANTVLTHFDGRLQAIEKQQARMLEILESFARAAGPGPVQ
jgi:hypothetical protein